MPRPLATPPPSSQVLTEERRDPALPGRHHPGRTGGRVVPAAAQRGSWDDGAARRLALPCPVLVSGRPLGVSGNPGNAVRCPVQQAAEQTLVRHLHLLLALSIVDRGSPDSTTDRVQAGGT